MHLAAAMNQSAMNILYKWCQLNRLSINLGKTEHTIVYKERIDSQELPVLRINNMALENVQSLYLFRGYC